MYKFFKMILKFSGKYRKRIWAATFFAVIKSMCIQMPVFLAFLMFNDFYIGKMTQGRCFLYLGGIASILIIHFIANYSSDVLQSAAGFQLFADKRMELGNILRKFPMGYFTSGNIGKISSVLSTDMNFVEENVMQSIAEMLSYALSSVVIVLFLFVIDWRVGLVSLISSLAVVIVGIYMNREAVKHSNIRQEQSERLTKEVISHIEGIGLIKSYNMLGEKSKQLTDNFRKTKDASLDFEFANIPWMFAQNIIYAAGMTAIFSLSLYLYQRGLIELPYLIGVVLFNFSLFQPIKALYGDAAKLTVMSSCLNRIKELFKVKQLKDTGDKYFEQDYKGPVIEFKNVSFAYDNKETISNVSFKVDKNTMTALVGPSGGGKTTIASLIVRFWDIKSGSIRVCGRDIREIPLSELMNKISMVFQRVYLFQDTVYNNISMGKPDATEEEVYEAAKKARCYDFIMKLPKGFNTVIGEGGASLSGGEKQRISIARCILKDAPIVILDEATASVDLDNERYIQEAISELVKGKTLLVIAHRLNTIQKAEQIIVVSNGKVSQCGNHDELMNEEGVYKHFIEIREKIS